MKKFEVGKTYYTRSACDHNCIYRFTVISRTAKMVTVIDGLGEKLKRKVESSKSFATPIACRVPLSAG